MRFFRPRRRERPLDTSSDDTIGRIALVTANFGGIDTVRALPSHPEVDGFYFTDAATRDSTDAATIATWRRFLVPDYPRHDFAPRLRGRYFKHQIHRLPEMDSYRWLAWADADIAFFDLGYLHAAARHLATLPPASRVHVVRHPTRDTVQQEYEAIRDAIAAGDVYVGIRYAAEKMAEQMAYFASRGWNCHAPLWCGTTWLIENNDVINRCWDDWWDQNLRYGLMDQLSLPVMLIHHGLAPQAASYDLGDNPHFEWCRHVKFC